MTYTTYPVPAQAQQLLVDSLYAWHEYASIVRSQQKADKLDSWLDRQESLGTELPVPCPKCGASPFAGCRTNNPARCRLARRSALASLAAATPEYVHIDLHRLVLLTEFAAVTRELEHPNDCVRVPCPQVGCGARAWQPCDANSARSTITSCFKTHAARENSHWHYHRLLNRLAQGTDTWTGLQQ